MLRSITRCIANYGRVVKFRRFLPNVNYAELAPLRYPLRPAQKISLYFRSEIKLEQFLLLFRALVFLIRSRNEYPLVGFIVARDGESRAGGQGISTAKLRVTYIPFKEDRGANERST